MNTIFVDFPDQEEDGNAEISPQQVQMAAEKWVKRCQCSAMVFLTIWFVWILTSQLLRSHLPSSLFMLNADDAELTGW